MALMLQTVHVETETHKPRRRAWWKHPYVVAVGSVGVYMLVGIACSFAGYASGVVQAGELGAALPTICMQLACCIIGLALMRTLKRDVCAKEEKPFVWPYVMMVILLVWVWFAGSLAASLVMALSDGVGSEAYVAQMQSMGAVYLVCSLVLAPIVEEVLFRGGVFPKLCEGKMPVWAAAVICALLFAATHLSVMHLIPTFMLGLLLCWIRARTGSVIACIGGHMAYNLLTIAMAGLDVPEWLMTQGAVSVLCGVAIAVTLILLMNEESRRVKVTTY